MSVRGKVWQEYGGEAWVGVSELVVLHNRHMSCSHGQQQTLIPGMGGAKHDLQEWVEPNTAAGVGGA